jgi:glycosyltransferase involved in cell wall biosynthesis
MEFWLLRGACVVVHSDWLRSLAATDFPQAVVAPHPPYGRTVEAVGLPATSEPDARVFCFVGALRHDKGADDLLELARRTERPWRLRIIGPDRMSMDVEQAVRSAGVSVEYTEPQPPSDEALIHAMAASAAMLAPYSAPTASGSVHLAVALGLPVLGLASTSFEKLVPEENQATDIAALALLVDQFVGPAIRAVPRPGAADLSVANAWAEAIRGA